MEQKINTKGLVESALSAAIISLIIILSGYFPFFFIISMIIIPIIISIVYYKNDSKYALTCICISILITFMTLDLVNSVLMGIYYGITGMTLGYCLRKGFSSYKTLILSVASVCIGLMISFTIFSIFIVGKNPLESVMNQATQISDLMNLSMDKMFELYKSMGVNEAQISVMEEFKSIITPEYVLMMFPSTIIFSSFIQGYISLAILRKLIKRILNYSLEPLKFEEFYVSNLVGAFLIALICIALILFGRGVSWAVIVYNSILMITILILNLNGVAAVKYFLVKKMMLSNVASILVILLTFITGLFVIFGIIGFAEMLLDFRKLDPHRLRKA